MGVVAAAWATAAVGAASAAYGASQNSKAAKANQNAYDQTRDDYASRLKLAAEGAAALNEQYNSIVGERPGLSWEEFVKDKIRAINDPFLREFYTKAKKEDYEQLREFAKMATTDNVENLQAAADKISNGRWNEMIDKRNELVLNTDASSRYARAYELSAPIRTDASTVKYEGGKLIEGQRADKQAFSIANEVQTQVEQEQKADLRALETDRLGAAERQAEKARGFMEFFDATGYATAAEADRTKLVHGYQQMDEERAFSLYEMFAGAAAGITPGDPNYQNAGPGNELISGGIKLATTGLSNYGNAQKQQKTTSTTY